MRLSIDCSKYLVLGGAAAAALLSTAAPAYAWEEIQWAGQTISGDPWTSPTTINEANGVTGPNGTVLTWTTSQLGVWDTIYFGGPTNSLWSAVTISLASVKSVNGYQDWTFDYSISNASQTKNSLVTDFSFTEASKLYLPSHTSSDITGDWNAIAFENDCKKNAYSSVSSCNSTYRTYVDSTVTLSDTRGTGGVNQGNTADGTFTVILANAANSFSLSNASVEYEYSSQGGPQYGPQYGLFSVSNCGPDGKTGPGYPVGWVPEPGTWALMLTGFFGLGLALRRRQQGMSPLAAA